eukprot:scaffold315302_cov13-Tisochrysis_lutea.AAC.1
MTHHEASTDEVDEAHRLGRLCTDMNPSDAAFPSLHPNRRYRSKPPENAIHGIATGIQARFMVPTFQIFQLGGGQPSSVLANSKGAEHLRTCLQ